MGLLHQAIHERRLSVVKVAHQSDISEMKV
jgi:hypothetical protein